MSEHPFNTPPDSRWDYNDPDCLRCMRTKLKAIGLVVFFRIGESWRIGNFQSDRPREAAEVEFEAMLRSGVPETVYEKGSALVLNDERDIASVFPAIKELFSGCAVIASAVCGEESPGIRLAWRDASDPFDKTDLEIIHCIGDCPRGCEACASR